MDRFACQLPGGYVDQDGLVLQQAVLSPLSGFEEKMIAESDRLSPSFLVTRLLGQCLRRIGPIVDVSEDLVRGLLVGDRQYLLLKLREITFGKEVRAVVNCSWPDCGERLDIDFLTDHISVIQFPQKGRFYEMLLSEAEGGERIVFRLPNGEDQELIAHHADDNEALASEMLLGVCVQSIGSFAPAAKEQIKKLSPRAKLEIEQEMDRLAPKVALNMEAFCPECERNFTLPFDLEAFVLEELCTRPDLLLREVHYLAYHYHWSEKEILGMTRENRRKYIEVLSDEIGRLNHAV